MCDVMSENVEIVYFLSRFWGGVGLVFAIILILKRDLFKSLLDEFDHLSNLSISLGIFTIILGIASISLYSKISFDWRFLITFYGWASLLKGARILIFPNALKDLIHSHFFQKYANFVILILGIMSAYLLSKGF